MATPPAAPAPVRPPNPVSGPFGSAQRGPSPSGPSRPPRTLPRRLKAYWMAFALRLGEIQTQILLAVMYFIVFGIANAVVRAARKDLLGKHVVKPSYWVAHERQPETFERFRHPF